MPRRAILLIALSFLAVLGAAAVPWTLSDKGFALAVAAHMKERYGIDFKVEGRSTFALLPIPRLKFENAELRLPAGALEAKAATVRGELRLLPLLTGRVELSEVSVSEAEIEGSLEALQSLKWAEIVRNRPDAAYARRIILAGPTLRWRDNEAANLRQVNLVVTWSGRNEALYAVGSALWRDEPVTLEDAFLYPDLLLANRLSPFSVTFTAPSGSISASGELVGGDDPRMTGEGVLLARSVRDFTRWSGVPLPFGSLLQGLSVKGDFSLDRRRLTWPSVAVSLGPDRLEGTLGVRFDSDRPLITGTLAAGAVNLTDLFQPLIQARTDSGAWNDEAVGLLQTAGAGLDLRLSASAAQIGRVRLEDMAASVLVRPGRVEASIGRAGLHSGSLKGRLSLAASGGAVEFKSQGTFAGVDMAGFLGALGQSRWITGDAQGQFQFEGAGQSPAEIVRRMQGRSSVTVKNGELVGLALSEALRRVEKRPLLASLQWKGGRTPFEQAQVHLAVRDGIGELADSRVTAAAVTAQLQGQVSLVERSVALKADVSAPDSAVGPTPALAFDVGGTWDNVSIVPNARALIERSGAARPLFGPNRAQAEPDASPVATAH